MGGRVLHVALRARGGAVRNHLNLRPDRATPSRLAAPTGRLVTAALGRHPDLRATCASLVRNVTSILAQSRSRGLLRNANLVLAHDEP